MAVAGRLSEDPSIAVAVLEAGMNVEELPEVCVLDTTLPIYTHLDIKTPGVRSGSDWNRKG